MTMTYDEITDIAYEVVAELEPAHSFDVFDVTDSHIMFQDDRGLFKVCLGCLDSNGSLKGQIKAELWKRG
jgi:hypothetical protein